MPPFLDESMTKEIMWRGDSPLSYDCSLNSPDTFSYLWYGPDSKILSHSYKLTINANDLESISLIFCHIFKDNKKIHEQPVTIYIEKYIQQPIIERISLIPRGFEAYIFYGINTFFVKSLSLICSNSKFSIKFTKKIIHSQRKFKIDDMLHYVPLTCHVISYYEQKTIKSEDFEIELKVLFS